MIKAILSIMIAFSFLVLFQTTSMAQEDTCLGGLCASCEGKNAGDSCTCKNASGSTCSGEWKCELNTGTNTLVCYKQPEA